MIVRWSTPQSTIDAVIWACRERGLQALYEPDTIERLRRCDGAARQRINERLARLFPAEAAE
jgi:hypothetical protein